MNFPPFVFNKIKRTRAQESKMGEERGGYKWGRTAKE